MAAARKLSANAQWAIALAVIGLGVAATLVIANAVNHAGWNPWVTVVAWAGIVALVAMLVKLRGSTGLSSRPMGPMGGRGSTHPGDGINAGDGGG